jgi:hypothetical protein
MIRLVDILREVQSSDFKSWFGNSRVVDSQGNPLEVYHGSEREIEQFYDGDVYFTDDYMNADGYASGEYVYGVYLSMQRPLVVDAGSRKWNDLDTPHGVTTHDVVGRVDRSKYDGVIFKNIKDSWIDDVDYQDAGTVYVVFSANQIRQGDDV